jgi:hypothetical protein
MMKALVGSSTGSTNISIIGELPQTLKDDELVLGIVDI